MTEQEHGKSSFFKCDNASCSRVFEKPLKTFDAKLGHESAYDACPFCLSRVTRKEEKSAEVKVAAPIEAERSENAFCQFHLGYLYERKAKDSVPDACLICKDIVTCMLQGKGK